MEKHIKINLEDKIVVLSVDDDNTFFDVEDILTIHSHNRGGDLVTSSIIMNRVGILKAQADDKLRRKKFECDIYEAELAEKLRTKMSTVETTKGGTKKIKAPVLDAVNNAVKMDAGYQSKMKEFFRAKLNAEYIDSFYWAFKSKDDKLKIMSQTTPIDFENELIDGVINGIKVKGLKKPFANSKRN